MEASARRSWNRTGTKATVLVTCPDGYTRQIGGDRAARCHFAIIYRSTAPGDRWQVLGLRSEPKGEGHHWQAIPITSAP